VSNTSSMNKHQPEGRRCPVCSKATGPETGAAGQRKRSKYFPFCSQRCKLIDLGAWLDAEYRIAANEKEEETESGDV